jgi:TDG/mug DNA glycosylase family protein
LEEVHLIPVPLGPHLDHRVLEFGIGLTDLAKGVAASSDRGISKEYDVRGLVGKMERFSPAWIAFHGKTAANAVAKELGCPTPVHLGRQTWDVAASSVFVVPSMSGANRDPTRLEGKPSREAWFAELQALLPAT